MTSAVLAAMRRQTSPTLASRHLAKASFALLTKGLHAFTAAAILDHELVVLLCEAISLDVSSCPI